MADESKDNQHAMMTIFFLILLGAVSIWGCWEAMR
jgi:hypothetical protein